jgi:2',3'-cyclic-nucleotide 2'-phosphodiesterase (5'-nucleotidase family)
MFGWAIFVATLTAQALACDSCYGPAHNIVQTRHVRRMQPNAVQPVDGPRSELAWGQLNILHTTDTHGWLEGHLKEGSYSADWGDFASFVAHMKQKAKALKTDLLLIDTGVRNGTREAMWPIVKTMGASVMELLERALQWPLMRQFV